MRIQVQRIGHNTIRYGCQHCKYSSTNKSSFISHSQVTHGVTLVDRGRELVPDPSHVHEINNAVVDDEEQPERPGEIEEVTLEEGGHSDDDDEVVVDPTSLLSDDMEEKDEEEEGADSVRDEIVEIVAN